MKNLIVLLLVLSIVSCKKNPENTRITGLVFGTSYSIIYDTDINYQKQIDSLYYAINKSMSTYQTNSDISKLNRNESNKVDEHFRRVLNTSKEINHQVKGVFDPTIGTIVNALGFGPEKRIERLDSLKIDSLMQFVGLDKVYIKEDVVIKKNKNTFIDFNAIGKGYAVDVIAEFLERKKVKNYIVEIGGEIRSKGKNVVKKSNWTVGIDKPNFDGTQSVLKAISLQDEAMATSGTYRKYKIDENGNRYAHILDAKTGYPSKSNILGVSVITSNCMSADAYATAFQAMGIEKTKSFLTKHPELKVFLIFENTKNELETLTLNNFPEN